MRKFTVHSAFRALASAALIASLAACGGTDWGDLKAKLPNVPQNEARLVFYRQSHFAGHGITLVLSIDGAEVGKVDSGTVLSVDHAPGTLRITVDAKAPLGLSALDRLFYSNWEVDYSLVANGGGTYYLELGALPTCNPYAAVGGFAGCGIFSATGGSSMLASDTCNHSIGWCIGLRDSATAGAKLDGLTAVAGEDK